MILALLIAQALSAKAPHGEPIAVFIEERVQEAFHRPLYLPGVVVYDKGRLLVRDGAVFRQQQLPRQYEQEVGTILQASPTSTAAAVFPIHVLQHDEYSMSPGTFGADIFSFYPHVVRWSRYSGDRDNFGPAGLAESVVSVSDWRLLHILMSVVVDPKATKWIPRIYEVFASNHVVRKSKLRCRWPVGVRRPETMVAAFPLTSPFAASVVNKWMRASRTEAEDLLRSGSPCDGIFTTAHGLWIVALVPVIPEDDAWRVWLEPR